MNNYMKDIFYSDKERWIFSARNRSHVKKFCTTVTNQVFLSDIPIQFTPETKDKIFLLYLSPR